jgi:asparagine synthase (glutamine-hydrolysing)
MAHSVEGRYPFLDYRVIEFCNRLPAKFKLNSLTEKYLLRQLAKKWLPEDIWQRPKRPYRAPIHRSFFGEKSQPYVRELLSPRWVEESGLFKPAAVFQMVQKLEAGKRLGETDDMALAGILSSQLVYQQFVTEFSNPSPVKPQEVLKSYSSHQFEQG